MVIDYGTIVDGSGDEPFLASIAIENGEIAAIGKHGQFSGRVVLSARDQIVAPGFIDAHSNLSWGLFVDPSCRIATRQGVTTAVTGNCGGSAFPNVGAAADWSRKAASDYGVEVKWSDLTGYSQAVPALGLDVVPLVGHGTLRAAVASFENRPLSTEELNSLLGLEEASLVQGAAGLSFGLAYPPGAFATREELVACCALAGRFGRVCCFHIRIESDELERAVDEIISLAEASRATCVVCHHKALGRRNWGKTTRTLQKIDDARKHGLEIYMDVYPYTTALRNLSMLLPDAAHEGGRAKLLERLRDESSRGQLAHALRENIKSWDADWADTFILDAPQTPEIEGSTADKIIESVGELGLLNLLEKNHGRILTLYSGSSEDDLERVACHQGVVIGSDGNSQHLGEKGHPRSFATFPRFLQEFAFHRKLLPLPDAVYRMTEASARLFGLSDRGRIIPGMRADICVFSPQISGMVAEATVGLQKPWPQHLLVNGKPTIEYGAETNSRPGQLALAT